MRKCDFEVRELKKCSEGDFKMGSETSKHTGYFHKWGVQGSDTLAIIEDERTGDIFMVAPSCVRFWTDDELEDKELSKYFHG